MRPKHFSLLIIVLSICTIGGAAWLETDVFSAGVHQDRPPKAAPLSELRVPPKTDLEQMDYLERRMHLLSAPPPQMRQRANLSGLGYVPLTAADPGLSGGKTTTAARSNYRLTLAFDGRAKRYCVIDDHLYAEGSVLPDGATIVRIESRRVLIAKERLQQWLDIAPLIDVGSPEES